MIGNGFETAKYVETLYNDIWIYSLEHNRWQLLFPRGEIPRAMYEHKAELIGDQMIVVGGILGQPKATLTSIDHSAADTVLILNIMTLTWSYIKITDPYGQSISLNLHGHSLTRGENGALYIFGGREAADVKDANIEYQPKSRHGHKNYYYELNITTQQLSILKPNIENRIIPENRCSHLAFSNVSIDRILKEQEDYFLNYKGKSYHQLLISSDESVSGEAENLFYIFGGIRITNTGGFCDPNLFLIYRLHTIYVPPAEEFMTPLTRSVKASFQFDEKNTPKNKKRISNFTMYNNDSSNQHSQQINNRSSECRPISSRRRFSMWEKIHIQQKVEVKNPSNWKELKLALIHPLNIKTKTTKGNYTENDKFRQLPPLIFKKNRKQSTSAADSITANNEPQLDEYVSSILGNLDELRMIPIEMNPREYIKLSKTEQRKLKVKKIANDLSSSVKGMTIMKAKSEYYEMFPPPKQHFDSHLLSISHLSTI